MVLKYIPLRMSVVTYDKKKQLNYACDELKLGLIKYLQGKDKIFSHYSFLYTHTFIYQNKD